MIGTIPLDVVFGIPSHTPWPGLGEYRRCGASSPDWERALCLSEPKASLGKEGEGPGRRVGVNALERISGRPAPHPSGLSVSAAVAACDAKAESPLPIGRGGGRGTVLVQLPDVGPYGWSSAKIVARTPAIFSRTSRLVTRTTRNPSASRWDVRCSSRATSEPVECVAPSTSTTNLPDSVTKSTTYRSITCCLRNFQPSSWRLRSACQSRFSALVSPRPRARARCSELRMPVPRIVSLGRTRSCREEATLAHSARKHCTA
jgi:hypothetical protein